MRWMRMRLILNRIMKNEKYFVFLLKNKNKNKFSKIEIQPHPTSSPHPFIKLIRK